jgi:hypothetical protein
MYYSFMNFTTANEQRVWTRRRSLIAFTFSPYSAAMSDHTEVEVYVDEKWYQEPGECVRRIFPQ